MEAKGDTKAALNARALVVASLSQIGPPSEVAREKSALAKLHAMEGNEDLAEKYFREAVSDYKKSSHYEGQLRALVMLAGILESLDRLQEAFAILQEARSVALGLGKSPQDIQVHGSLGLQAYDDGDLATAQDHYNHAITLAKVFGCQGALGLTYNNLGLVKFKQGNVDEAISLTRTALFIAAERGNKDREASALANLGRCFRVIGDFERAASSFEEAGRLFEALGDADSLAWARDSLKRLNEP